MLGDNVYAFIQHDEEISQRFIQLQNDGARYLAIAKEDVADTYKTHYTPDQLFYLVDMKELSRIDTIYIRHAFYHYKRCGGCYVVVDGKEEVAFEMVVKNDTPNATHIADCGTCAEEVEVSIYAEEPVFCSDDCYDDYQDEDDE